MQYAARPGQDEEESVTHLAGQEESPEACGIHGHDDPGMQSPVESRPRDERKELINGISAQFRKLFGEKLESFDDIQALKGRALLILESQLQFHNEHIQMERQLMIEQDQLVRQRQELDSKLDRHRKLDDFRRDATESLKSLEHDADGLPEFIANVTGTLNSLTTSAEHVSTAIGNAEKHREHANCVFDELKTQTTGLATAAAVATIQSKVDNLSDTTLHGLKATLGGLAASSALVNLHGMGSSLTTEAPDWATRTQEAAQGLLNSLADLRNTMTGHIDQGAERNLRTIGNELATSLRSQLETALQPLQDNAVKAVKDQLREDLVSHRMDVTSAVGEQVRRELASFKQQQDQARAADNEKLKAAVASVFTEQIDVLPASMATQSLSELQNMQQERDALSTHNSEIEAENTALAAKVKELEALVGHQQTVLNTRVGDKADNQLLRTSNTELRQEIQQLRAGVQGASAQAMPTPQQPVPPAAARPVLTSSLPPAAPSHRPGQSLLGKAPALAAGPRSQLPSTSSLSSQAGISQALQTQAGPSTSNGRPLKTYGRASRSEPGLTLLGAFSQSPQKRPASRDTNGAPKKQRPSVSFAEPAEDLPGETLGDEVIDDGQADAADSPAQEPSSTGQRQTAQSEGALAGSADEGWSLADLTAGLRIYHPEQDEFQPFSALPLPARLVIEPLLLDFALRPQWSVRYLSNARDRRCQRARCMCKSRREGSALQACEYCCAKGLPCVLVDKDMPPTLVPLPPELREGATLQDAEYWIVTDPE